MIESAVAAPGAAQTVSARINTDPILFASSAPRCTRRRHTSPTADPGYFFGYVVLPLHTTDLPQLRLDDCRVAHHDDHPACRSQILPLRSQQIGRCH